MKRLVVPILLLLSGGIGLVAQTLFDGRPFPPPILKQADGNAQSRAACWLLLAAIAVSMLVPDRESASAAQSGPLPQRRSRFHLPLLISALVCWAAGNGLFAFRQDGVLVGPLWGLGIILLLASQAAATRFDDEVSDRWRGLDLLLLAGILALAFALRFVGLPHLPSELDGDFATAGIEAISAMESPHRFVGVGAGHSPLIFYWVFAWSMKVFGLNLYGLMMSSVILGTLGVGATFLLGRELFGPRVGLIAAGLVAISYTHIQFSRVVLTPGAMLSLTVTAYALLRGLRTSQPFHFALAGVSVAYGMVSYWSGRMGPVLVFCVFVSLALFDRRKLMGNLRGWAVFVLGAIVGYGPTTMYSALNFSSFVGRASAVTLFSKQNMDHEMYSYKVSTVSEVLVEQMKRGYLTLFYYSDGSSEFTFPGPMVDALTSVLLMVGLGLSLRRIADTRFAALLSLIFFSILLGTVMTLDPPDWVHINVVIPPVAVIAAHAADRLWTSLEDLAPRLLRPVVTVVLAAILLFLGARTGKSNWTRYVAHVGDNSGPRTAFARYVNFLPGDTRVLLAANGIGWRDREFEFYDRGVQGRDVTEGDLRQVEVTDPTAIILTADNEHLLAGLKERFPSGRLEEIRTHGWLHGYAYLIRPAGSAKPPAPPHHAMGEPEPLGMFAGALIAAWAAGAGLVRLLGSFRRPEPLALAG